MESDTCSPVKEQSTDPTHSAICEHTRPTELSLRLLQRIDWKLFEEVCAEYFRLCGFHAITQSCGADGGVDIQLSLPADPSHVVDIVQCKKWGKPVGIKPLRELLGVMAATKISHGVFATSSTFNDEAKKFAAENHIHLLDGASLLKRMQERPRADQERLLKRATDGDYLTPTCPSCGIKLVSRHNRKNASTFWGCRNYPRCRYTLSWGPEEISVTGIGPA